MKIFQLCFLCLVLVLLSSCGVLSNQHFFEGEGRVQGKIVIDGEPVSGVLVFALGEPEFMTTTAADGSFELMVSAGEDRQLIAMWGANLGLRQAFDLAGDVRLDLGRLSLSEIGELVGGLDHPDPGQAEALIAGTPFLMRPDQAGAFRFLLPAGRWDLNLKATGYQQTWIEDVETDSGQTRKIQTSSLLPDPDYQCTNSETLIDRFSQGGQGAVDILFIIDSSGSMFSRQEALASSFGEFATAMENGELDFHLAVLTTGMKSPGCPICSDAIPQSCINETGEGGRFQDLLGENLGTVEDPNMVFESDPACRVVTRENLDCFYDAEQERGTILVGTSGCGYERGLASIRTALGDLAATHNAGFLRRSARLAIVIMTDEEDCGEVGEVSEGLTGISGTACFFAAKGEDPEGNTVDPEGKPYQLTPVEEYALFFEELKAVPGLVNFSAIVGVEDVNDPGATEITYEYDEQHGRYSVLPACVADNCEGQFCPASPGTRYIEMAQRLRGSVHSICNRDFSQPLLDVAGVTNGYRREFGLTAVPLEPEAMVVRVNGVAQSDGWRWDDGRRVVEFDEDAAPPPYALVEIVYEAACS